MKEKANRVLLCTHTNSAADIHVELLHEYLNKTDGVAIQASKPLRIYDPERRVSTASLICRKYALIKDDTFLMPTRRYAIDHRVFVTTLTTADLLTKLNVHHGYFSHILIDEAAQAWETEALIPLALAGPNTKIVFTGDHMQVIILLIINYLIFMSLILFLVSRVKFYISFMS
jgi:helicase MOV-10